MAFLAPEVTKFDEENRCPAGTYEAKLYKIIDLPDHENRKFGTNETEIIHACRLSFVISTEGVIYYETTWPFKVINTPQSNFFQVFSSIKGTPIVEGEDLESLIGTDMIVQVVHKTSANGKEMVFVSNQVMRSPTQKPNEQNETPPSSSDTDFDTEKLDEDGDRKKRLEKLRNKVSK